MGRKPFNPDLAVGGKEAATPMANRKAAAREHLTVWQLTQQIKDAIESCLPSTVHVVGQLSNVKHHSSGHLYFTLKDDRSEIACIAWRSVASKLKFTPSDGMDVLASGSVSVFERSGRYQLYVRSLAPQGIGALELAFRQLCEKLKDEGLFDTHRKRELPRYPQRVAVITSPSGAALHDILDTLRRRYACAEVVFCPVAVQGAGAAGAIARAIRRVNREATPLGGIDVMIVGRGGGSIEDLWAFNEEVVARAIYASAIPVISAVGHESDVTIADFVADVRAATPTAAAELAVPQSGEVADELTYLFSAMARSMRHRIDLGKARLAAAAERAMLSDPARLLRERSARLDILSFALTSRVGGQQSYLRRRMAELALVLERLAPERFLAEMRGVVRVRGHRLTMALSRGLADAGRRVEARALSIQRSSPSVRLAHCQDSLDALSARIHRSIAHALQDAMAEAEAQGTRLRAMGYQATLTRGFSITRLKRGRALVRSAEQLRVGDQIVTELASGAVESRVLDSNQGELFE